MLDHALSRYLGLGVYAFALRFCGADEEHWPDSGMYGLDYATYNFGLAGVLTYACDWFNVVAILDSMLQAV